MANIPYQDAANLAERGFRKLSLARQQRRACLSDGANATEDVGLAEVSKAFLLARARVQRAIEEGSIDSSACPAWLTDLGHRLAAKYNTCAMSGLNAATTPSGSASAIAGIKSAAITNGNNGNDDNDDDDDASSSLARTLPSFHASGSPTRKTPGSKTNANTNANTLLPSTASFDYGKSKDVSKSLERRIKMLSQVVELTRSRRDNVLNDDDRLTGMFPLRHSHAVTV